MVWAGRSMGLGGHKAGPGAGHRAEQGAEAYGRTGYIAWGGGVRDARRAQRDGDATRRVEGSEALSQEQRGRCFSDGYKRVLGEVAEERMSGTRVA